MLESRAQQSWKSQSTGAFNRMHCQCFIAPASSLKSHFKERSFRTAAPATRYAGYTPPPQAPHACEYVNTGTYKHFSMLYNFVVAPTLNGTVSAPKSGNSRVHLSPSSAKPLQPLRRSGTRRQMVAQEATRSPSLMVEYSVSISLDLKKPPILGSTVVTVSGLHAAHHLRSMWLHQPRKNTPIQSTEHQPNLRHREEIIGSHRGGTQFTTGTMYLGNANM